jgi:serine/threonine protein kinase
MITILKCFARKVFAWYLVEDARKEMDIMSRLGTENINVIKLLQREIGQLPTGESFLDMELCDLDLRQYLDNHKECQQWWLHSLESGQRTMFIVGIMQQLLNGLYYIQSFGLAHRDLKPDNGIYHFVYR